MRARERKKRKKRKKNSSPFFLLLLLEAVATPREAHRQEDHQRQARQQAPHHGPHLHVVPPHLPPQCGAGALEPVGLRPQVVCLVDEVLYPLAPRQHLLDVVDHDGPDGVDLGLQSRDLGGRLGVGREGLRGRGVLVGEVGADRLEVGEGEGAARAVIVVVVVLTLKKKKRESAVVS